MIMRVLRVFTPSSRSFYPRLLTHVPVVETFLQVLHDVQSIRRKLYVMGVAMHLQVLDELPALRFRPFRPDHAILRRTAGFPRNVSAAKLVTNVGVSGDAGIEQEAAVRDGPRAEPKIDRVEVARANPEFLVTRIGGAEQLVDRWYRSVVQEGANRPYSRQGTRLILGRSHGQIDLAESIHLLDLLRTVAHGLVVLRAHVVTNKAETHAGVGFSEIEGLHRRIDLRLSRCNSGVQGYCVDH